MIDKNKIIQVLIALGVFVLVSLAYFSPVLEGKQINQSDIAQFRGVSKEIVDYRKEHDAEPYWTNRVFGGLPTYQVSIYYPHNYIKKVDSVLRFLPRPADYLFLYFLGFFVLLSVLKIDWRLAIIGALAFGFSTYFISIFAAGHNAKAHAIAYMPMVLAGILLVFKRNYFAGFVLTALAMSFEISASHPQMTYYLLFMVLILGLVYVIDAFKKKEFPHFLKSVGILTASVVLAVGVNATGLMATKEYAATSTRSKSELTILPNGQAKEHISSGLSREYITQYSIGLTESFNILIPRFYGGGSSEKIGKNSETYQFLKDKIGRRQAQNFVANFPAYWGEQIIVEAPFYIGSVMIFLFVLGLFLVKGSLKNWLFAATVFSLFMSWGRHFPSLTNFFIDYVPLYNKFRAVSSIQVIAELAVPLLALISLNQFLKDKEDHENKLKALKSSFFILVGLLLFFTVFGTSLFNFESFRDASWEEQLAGISEVFVADRKALFFKDSLRSLVLVLISAGILWFFLKERITKNIAIILFAVVVLFDLVGVDRRYVNTENFVTKTKVERPLKASEIDREILKDKSYYRVANFMVNPMNDGSTSYFHNSIGGYHAAKPRRYEELFEYQIARNNTEVWNMLNVKYIIFPDKDGIARMQQNIESNGNAWFVNRVDYVETADHEMKSLDSLSTKQKAIVASSFKDIIPTSQFIADSTATIVLKSYQPNEMIYESSTAHKQLAVFSEMYYKNGWDAYIDGDLVPHARANYVLRALVVPAGSHEIIFKFEPTIVKKGNIITLISYGLLLIVIIAWFFFQINSSKNESS